MRPNSPSTRKSIRHVIALALLAAATAGFAAPPLAPESPDIRSFIKDPVKLEAYDTQQLTMKGRGLPAKEAKKLETKLAAHPDDLDTRTELLGYYEMAAFNSAVARAAREKHILWVINHRPDAYITGQPETNLDPIMDGDAYIQGKQAWLKWANQFPRDTKILGNAAEYFLLSDKDTTEKLLREAQTLEPKNPQWRSRLGQLYSLQMPSDKGEKRQYWAKRAFLELEAAHQLTPNDPSDYGGLTDLAKIAFEAGEFDKARKYASDLLTQAKGDDGGWNFGNSIYIGNMVLGRLALKDGDTEKAKADLLAAGKTRGSPQLDSFGPNMSLARDLLEKGERATVLQFFDECAKFWKTAALKEWTATVKKGGMPDFGANLEY